MDEAKTREKATPFCLLVGKAKALKAFQNENEKNNVCGRCYSAYCSSRSIGTKLQALHCRNAATADMHVRSRSIISHTRYQENREPDFARYNLKQRLGLKNNSIPYENTHTTRVNPSHRTTTMTTALTQGPSILTLCTEVRGPRRAEGSQV